MNRRDFHAVIWVLALLITPVSAAAQRRCNPPGAMPAVMCDDGDGISYQCPPCRPAREAHATSMATLEAYRESLENYREALEDGRERDPDGSLAEYRKGMEDYREGIETYRESQMVRRTANAGQQ